MALSILRRSTTTSAPTTTTNSRTATPSLVPLSQHRGSNRATSIKSEIVVKHEPNEPYFEDYEPSRELRDAFSGVPQEEDVKPHRGEESHEQELGDDEEEDGTRYQPSEDWAEAFSTLQSQLQLAFDGTGDGDSDAGGGGDGYGHGDEGYVPSEGLLEALASLPQEMIDLPGSEEVRVKNEPRDDTEFLSSHPVVRVKREPDSPDATTLGLAKRIKLE